MKHPIKKLPPITSLRDLNNKAYGDPKYKDLAIKAAKNLGGENILTMEAALRWLSSNANETSEEGVVAEINFCR